MTYGDYPTQPVQGWVAVQYCQTLAVFNISDLLSACKGVTSYYSIIECRRLWVLLCFLLLYKVGIYVCHQSWRAGLCLFIWAPLLQSICYTTSSISGGQQYIAIIIGVTIFLIVVQSWWIYMPLKLKNWLASIYVDSITAKCLVYDRQYF